VFFQQVLYRDLGCASYVLGDAGEALVVDPRLDIDVYLEIARREGLRITHVVDTHDHADHVSGRVKLSELAGAVAHRAARPEDPRPQDLGPGEELRFGRLCVRALPTPGHRPEHIALLVSDESRSPDPWMVLSGDSLLLGDLARPDLAVDPVTGARDLHASVHRILELGEHIEVWPGHVGGSLCGGACLSQETSSTVGQEVRSNPLLSLALADFADRLIAGVPTRPPNVAHIVEINRRTHLELPATPPLLAAGDLERVLDRDVTVLDARHSAAFDEGHIAGAVNMPVSVSALGTRAGWALRADERILITAQDEADANAMTRALHAVGLWRIIGVALQWDGLPTVSARSWSIGELADGLREQAVALIDVREPSEWRSGHVRGSVHMPLARLGSGRDLDATAPAGTVAVACAGGGRAAFAASLLRRRGWSEVVRVSGGGIGNLPDYGVSLVGGES
jgi:glyoxylase-like metal-dependent hydrolase (beta-lactamase superfamily II)/rhodanese-related sulfurtransferase